MPLQPTEEQDLMDWVKKMNSGAVDNENDPRGTISSPTPPVPATPALAPVNTGQGISEMENDAKIKDSHPGHQPMDLSGAIQADKSSIDEYGPAQEKAVYENILKSRGDIGNRLTRGAASIGDALMANAGRNSPGFLNSINEREARTDKMKLDEVPGLRKANMETISAKKSLDAKDPNSELSKAKRAGYAPLFSKLGYSPEKMADMSAADLDTAASLMTQFGGDEIKAEATKAQLENETAKINAQIEQMRQTSENQQTEKELRATTELSKRGPIRRFIDFFSESPETAKLKEEAGITGHPDDAVALEWAKNNPGDPRAKAIFKLHGL